MGAAWRAASVSSIARVRRRNSVTPAKSSSDLICWLIAAGVTRSAGYALLGGHALGTGGFEFASTAVPEEALLFAPGAGLKAALAGIDVARMAVAAMCCGMLETALERALEHTAARPVFGQRVADFQGVQWMLADCATDLAAAQALTDEAQPWPVAFNPAALRRR